MNLEDGMIKKGGHELKGWHDNCKSFEKQNILVN